MTAQKQVAEGYCKRISCSLSKILYDSGMQKSYSLDDCSWGMVVDPNALCNFWIQHEAGLRKNQETVT